MNRRAFSLIELLVAMTIFILIMTFLFSMISQGERVWVSSTGKIGAFREARTAFESLNSTLSQASLNPYWDYDDANNPTNYVRRSELRFTSGPGLLPNVTSPTHSVFFQVPLGRANNSTYLGMETLFNSCGYYIEYSDDSVHRPPFLTDLVQTQTRFRLVQWLEPSEKWQLFNHTSGNPGYSSNDWFSDPVEAGIDTHVLAENVIALVVLPKLSTLEDPTGTVLAPSYSYSSAPANWPPSLPQAQTENQLPPVLQVTMVTLHENAVDRLEEVSGGTPVEFLGLDNLFQEANQLSADLETLTGLLNQHKLRHHVFQSAIKIRGSKWSRE